MGDKKELFKRSGCVYCRDYGVRFVAPLGSRDGLGYVQMNYCFCCGRKIEEGNDGI